MRKLTVTSERYTNIGPAIRPRRQPRLGQILCDGIPIGSLRELETVTLPIDSRRHVVQCVEESPQWPGRTVSDIVCISPGEEDVSLRLKWGEQTLFLTAK